jgi:hypothetical protein
MISACPIRNALTWLDDFARSFAIRDRDAMKLALTITLEFLACTGVAVMFWYAMANGVAP